MKSIVLSGFSLFLAFHSPAQELVTKRFFSGKYADKEIDSCSKATRIETVVRNADGTLTRTWTALPGRVVILSETRRGLEPMGCWIYRDKKGKVMDSLDYNFSLLRAGDSGVEFPRKPGSCDTTKISASSGADPFQLSDGSDFRSFLGNNLRYPDDAREAGVEGRVIINALINEEGMLENLIVVRSLHPTLDKEAARVMRAMRLVKPTAADGKPTRRCVSIPVKFTLE